MYIKVEQKIKLQSKFLQFGTSLLKIIKDRTGKTVEAQDITSANFEQFNEEMYLGRCQTSTDALAIFAKKLHHKRLTVS